MAARRLGSEPALKDLFPIKLDHNLQLRLLEKKDALKLYKLVDSSRTHLKRWLPFVDDYRSVDAAIDFISRCHEKLRERSGLGIGIWSEKTLAGIVTYDYFDWYNLATRIGYWLGKPFEGRGLMTRTCSALVDLAFHELDMNRVEIWCALENKRCRLVPERLGFEEEGVYRQRERVRNHFVDIVSYSMLRDEWKNRRAEAQTRI